MVRYNKKSDGLSRSWRKSVSSLDFSAIEVEFVRSGLGFPQLPKFRWPYRLHSLPLTTLTAKQSCRFHKHKASDAEILLQVQRKLRMFYYVWMFVQNYRRSVKYDKDKIPIPSANDSVHEESISEIKIICSCHKTRSSFHHFTELLNSSVSYDLMSYSPM
jgi:hypothetical protein